MNIIHIIIYGSATFACGQYIDMSGTFSPSVLPTFSPTDSPTEPDYIWYVGTDYSTRNDTISYEFECGGFGCTTSGCSVEKSIEVIGQCTNPKLTVEIVETDYYYSNEYVNIYINGDFIASCEPLDEYCTHDWVTCQNIQDYNISSYISNCQ